MRVALTGTPGVGKTTLADEARRAGWQVVDVKAWARACGAVVGHDASDDADVVDVQQLAAAVGRFPTGPQHVLFEGHLSHELPVDQVWVVRLDPTELRRRLEARGYSASKVQENLEAEALDLLLMEALDTGRPVRQRDGTRRSPPQMWKAFAVPGFEQLKGHDLERVDWSDRLPL